MPQAGVDLEHQRDPERVGCGPGFSSDIDNRVLQRIMYGLGIMGHF